MAKNSVIRKVVMSYQTYYQITDIAAAPLGYSYTPSWGNSVDKKYYTAPHQWLQIL